MAPEDLSDEEDKRFRRTLALFGLGSVLLFLAFCAIFGSYYSYAVGASARQQTELSNQFKQARFAISSEDTLTRRYASSPGADLRLSHMKSRRAFAKAMGVIQTIEQDDGSTKNLVALHDTYVQVADRYFDLLDRDDAPGAVQVAKAEMDPAFNALEIAVVVSALKHHNASMVNLSQLVANQEWIAIATAFVFVVGLYIVAHFVGVLRRLSIDISEAQQRETESIQRSAAKLQSLVQNASDVILICDASTRISYQSPSAKQMWLYPDESLIGEPLTALLPEADQETFRNVWDSVVREHGSVRKLDLQVNTADQSVKTVSLTISNKLDTDLIAGIVVTAQDITERKTYELQLTRKAFYDPLTDLPNRAFLQERLNGVIAQGGEHPGRVAVLFIDIDNFKQINDSLGHATGDELVMLAARRLADCCSEGDILARFGGDEFVILRDGVKDSTETQALAETILENFTRKFMLDGKDYGVSVSIGIALGERGATSSEGLIRNADIAMYKAKNAGKGRFVLFEEAMHMSAVDQLDLVRDLQDVLARQELYLEYQPVLDLKTGVVTEAEALVRWKHPRRGTISPLEFIPVAESTGLILPIGRWVLETACAEAARWPVVAGSSPVSISVNLSTVQFQQAGLIDDIARALDLTGLEPARLKLEITESAIMQDVDTTVATLTGLKALGVSLAIDDFGTGYSSLSYLKRLPLDVLKIDRSFIHGITENEKDVAIVVAIVTLAKTLNLSITAEGIETWLQSELLKSWQVERGQGYLFSRPLAGPALQQFLAQQGETRQQQTG